MVPCGSVFVFYFLLLTCTSFCHTWWRPEWFPLAWRLLHEWLLLMSLWRHCHYKFWLKIDLWLVAGYWERFSYLELLFHIGYSESLPSVVMRGNTDYELSSYFTVPALFCFALLLCYNIPSVAASVASFTVQEFLQQIALPTRTQAAF